jgi:hypothetical protein
MVMIKFILIILFNSGISLVGKTQSFSVTDSLRFSQDSTTVWLSLTFSKPLSQDTLYYEQNLPFSFFILSPKDSIQLNKFITNENFTNYELEFSIKRNQSYSLLSTNMRSNEGELLDNLYSKTIINKDLSKEPLKEIEVNLFASTAMTKTLLSDDALKTTFFISFIKKSQLKDNKLYNTNYNQILHDDAEKIADSTRLGIVDLLNSSSFISSGFNLDLYIPNWFLMVNTKLNYFANDSVIVFSFGFIHDYLESKITYLNLKKIILSESTLYEYLDRDVNNALYNQSSFLYENHPTLVDYSNLKYADIFVKDYLWGVGIGQEENYSFGDKQFSIFKSYPNPFNPSTTLTFSVANSSSISFSVYDILGRRIQSLEHKDVRYSAGTHSFMYDFSGLPSGTYFIEAIGTELGSGLVSRQVAKVSLVK